MERGVCVCVCVRVCACACVRACVRACERESERASKRAWERAREIVCVRWCGSVCFGVVCEYFKARLWSGRLHLCVKVTMGVRLYGLRIDISTDQKESLRLKTLKEYTPKLCVCFIICLQQRDSIHKGSQLLFLRSPSSLFHFYISPLLAFCTATDDWLGRHKSLLNMCSKTQSKCSQWNLVNHPSKRSNPTEGNWKNVAAFLCAHDYYFPMT